MIAFTGETATSGVLEGLGFSGENEGVMRTPSLNSDIARPDRTVLCALSATHLGPTLISRP